MVFKVISNDILIDKMKNLHHKILIDWNFIYHLISDFLSNLCSDFLFELLFQFKQILLVFYIVIVIHIILLNSPKNNLNQNNKYYLLINLLIILENAFQIFLDTLFFLAYVYLLQI